MSSSLAAAFRRQVDHVAGLAGGAASLDVPVPGLEWTAAQLCAHLVVVYRGFGSVMGGTALGLTIPSAPQPTLPGFLAQTNEALLQQVSVSDPADAAAQLRAAGSVVAGLLDVEPADPLSLVSTPWYGDVALPLRAVRSHPLSETLVHGRDLALALRQMPALEEESSALVAGTVMRDMYPHLVNRETTAGVRVRYEVRIRGGERFLLSLDDGVCVTGPVGPMPADCVLSLDPRHVLLVGFARESLWQSMVRGGTLAWGPKPWLGLRLRRYFLVA